MSLEKLLRHLKYLDPLNQGCPKYLSALKMLGLGGLIVSLPAYFGLITLRDDIDPKSLVWTSLISAGIYFSGIASDYLVLKKAKKNKLELDRKIKISTQRLYQDSTNKKRFREMLEIYPLFFRNKNFLNKYPGIKEVAYHIYSEIKDAEIKNEKLLTIWNKFPLFYEIELTNFEQYLCLLRDGDPKIVK
ncbi:hypothetical protein KY342_04445, partial [Candidatus Woesearchaeota archaeon]|nr:hypothetical protein [Candidatus Woesearchaeota archaeon]